MFAKLFGQMKLLAVAPLILLAACGPMTLSAGTTKPGLEDLCTMGWREVSWAAKDTPATIDQIKASNSRRRAWGCPAQTTSAPR